MKFTGEYQQFDVLVVPDKQADGARLANCFSLHMSKKERERFEQDLALYFYSCVLDSCGLPLSASSSSLPAPESLDALQLGLAEERIRKLRNDFESYLIRAHSEWSTNHEVS